MSRSADEATTGHSAALSRAARVAYSAWLVAALVLVAALCWRHIGHGLRSDGLWYVAEGDDVLRQGRLPAHDVFSFASVQARWLLPMPGTEIGFAWVLAHWGLWALLALATLSAAAARALYWLPHATTPVARLLTLPFVILAVEVEGQKMSPRGQVLGDLGFALLLACLWRLKGGARLSPAIPLVLSAVWTNLHPSSLLVAVLPPVVAGTLLLDPPEERPPLVPFFRFAALGILASGATPYGYRLPLESLRLATDESTAWIDVFRTPPFHAPIWLLAVASALLVLGLRMRAGATRQRRSDAAFVLLFVALMCVAERYGPLLAGVCVVMIGRLASTSLDEPKARSRALLCALVGATCAQAGIATYFFQKRMDPWAHDPVAAAAFIQDHALPDHVMNLFGWGGYLDYAWRGERKVFIDGRTMLYTNGVFADSRVIEDARPGWTTLLDVYEIGTVLDRNGSRLDRALSETRAWREVFRDSLAVVYVRAR